MKVKQVLIIRKDLKMRKGKIASQASHASMKVFIDMFNKDIKGGGYSLKNFSVPTDGYIDYWLNNSFTKICVSVDSKEELIEVYNKALDKKIPCSIIEDNGDTEFKGVKTFTAVAIGPWDSDEIDTITSNLKLL